MVCYVNTLKASLYSSKNAKLDTKAMKRAKESAR